MTRLAAIVLTLNEAEHIQACVKTLQFADFVLVFDSFSKDATVELAREAGVEVKQHMFENYAQQRNAALDAVTERADWVLFVDADERVTPELADEVRQVIESGKHHAYGIPRWNYIFGKLTKGAGWYPDYQTRLLRVGAGRFDPSRKVHEVIEFAGTEGRLDNHFIHYNYRDAHQFAEKQRKYTRYEAQIMFEQGIRPKFRNFILQPLRHFRWRYLTLKGYQDRLHGLRLSLLMSWYELQKYIILRGMWRGQR